MHFTDCAEVRRCQYNSVIMEFVEVSKKYEIVGTAVNSTIYSYKFFYSRSCYAFFFA